MSTPMALSLDTYADWRDAAETAVHQLIDADSVFSADDLHRMVDDSALTSAQKSSWPGALFKDLARRGVIEKVAYGASSTRSRRGGARFSWQGVRR